MAANRSNNNPQGNNQHSQSGGNSQSGNRGNGQSGNQGNQGSRGVQGGTPEQHAAAGRQSHKNDR